MLMIYSIRKEFPTKALSDYIIKNWLRASMVNTKHIENVLAIIFREETYYDYV